MLNLFHKDTAIYSPVRGLCKKIEECKDKTFADKILGNGFMVEPDEGCVYSPCTGKITSIFPTFHAFGFEMSNGTEVLLHIGVDTVKLQKGTFKSSWKIGDKVKAKDKLVTFDLDDLKKNNINTSIMIVVLNEQDITLERINTSVNYGDIMIKMEEGHETS